MTVFERFTSAARQAVVQAQTEARDLHHGWIGTEHLLLAVLTDAGTPLCQELARVGVRHDCVRDQVRRELGCDGEDDAAALRDLGIDLDDVRRRVEQRFGAGALDHGSRPARRRNLLRRVTAISGGHQPFTRRAEQALELSMREAVALHGREIRVEHLLLGVLRADGLATRVVCEIGVSPDVVRRLVLDLLRDAA